MQDKFTVLYVEDDELTRESFTSIFENYFDVVITAQDGLEGLELYKKHNVDVAILDVSLPKMNGLALAEKMREINESIEIIMLTGHSDKNKLIKAINLQLFSYLIKPVKKFELDDAIEKVLNTLHQKSSIGLKFGYSYHTPSNTLYYKGIPSKLSKNESLLVKHLAENINMYYTACDISSSVFNNEDEKDSTCNKVVQLISRFKKKMLDLHNTDEFFIDKIYGLGYSIQKV